MVRTLACHARGRGFESRRSRLAITFRLRLSKLVYGLLVRVAQRC